MNGRCTPRSPHRLGFLRVSVNRRRTRVRQPPTRYPPPALARGKPRRKNLVCAPTHTHTHTHTHGVDLCERPGGARRRARRAHIRHQSGPRARGILGGRRARDWRLPHRPGPTAALDGGESGTRSGGGARAFIHLCAIRHGGRRPPHGAAGRCAAVASVASTEPRVQGRRNAASTTGSRPRRPRAAASPGGAVPAHGRRERGRVQVQLLDHEPRVAAHVRRRSAARVDAHHRYRGLCPTVGRCAQDGGAIEASLAYGPRGPRRRAGQQDCAVGDGTRRPRCRGPPPRASHARPTTANAHARPGAV